MQFIKDFFKNDKLVIGLSALEKQQDYVVIPVPSYYKKTKIQNVEKNYILF